MSPLGHILPSGFLGRATSRQALLQRTRATLVVVAVASVMLAIGDLARGGGGLPLRLGVRALVMVAALAALPRLRGPATARWAVPIALFAAIAVTLITVFLETAEGDLPAMRLMLVVIVLGTAALLPWGVRAQMVIVAVAAGAGLWGRAWGAPLVPSTEVIAAAFALMLSIYVAYAFERHREELELLLQSAGEGIYGIDAAARCTFVNPAALRMTGHRRAEDVLGKEMHGVLHHSHADGSPYPADGSPIYRVLRSGQGCRVAGEVLWRADGTSFPVEYSAFPIVEAGAVRGTVVNFADASARLEAERMRRELTAMLSHDLKTPLGVVLGLTEILRDDPPEDPAERRKLFDTIEVSARRAVGLAVNFVDAARIHGGALRLDRQTVSLPEIVAESVGEQQALARSRGVQIDTALARDLPPVSVDRQMIDRVIANLLSNAPKFSPPGARVRVSLDRAGDDLLLAVAEQGPGIAPEEQSKLFQPYSQLARTARKDSSGLGLFIVRTIAEAHGGGVRVQCPPGGGSVFEVRLPVLSRP